MELTLTKGYVAVVDDNDPKKPEQFKWTAQVAYRKDGSVRTVYAYRTTQQQSKKQKHYLHRFLLDTSSQVDHRDGNGLNCRRRNLRAATSTQNNRNANRRTDNVSGTKGVCWHKHANKWHVDIGVNKRKIYLGLYGTLQDAERARAAAVRKYHGEFAKQ